MLGSHEPDTQSLYHRALAPIKMKHRALGYARLGQDLIYLWIRFFFRLPSFGIGKEPEQSGQHTESNEQNCHAITSRSRLETDRKILEAVAPSKRSDAPSAVSSVDIFDCRGACFGAPTWAPKRTPLRGRTATRPRAITPDGWGNQIALPLQSRRMAGAIK